MNDREGPPAKLCSTNSFMVQPAPISDIVQLPDMHKIRISVHKLLLAGIKIRDVLGRQIIAKINHSQIISH